MSEGPRVTTARVENVVGCARCGEDHAGIEFEPLTRPLLGFGLGNPERPLTHWAPCPTNGEPILLSIFPTGGR